MCNNEQGYYQTGAEAGLSDSSDLLAAGEAVVSQRELDSVKPFDGEPRHTAVARMLETKGVPCLGLFNKRPDTDNYDICMEYNHAESCTAIRWRRKAANA